MTFRLNTKKHVKIWLSKNPSVFLNQQNQLRLIHMRHKNPEDVEIHLVYAESLLNTEAISELKKFCTQHHIIPVSIEDVILPQALNDNEHVRNLVKIYQQEVTSLGNGGCVAAAKDILCWIPAIFRLGIYSDFDVDINTSGLPPFIEVKQGILLIAKPLKIEMISEEDERELTKILPPAMQNAAGLAQLLNQLRNSSPELNEDIYRPEINIDIIAVISEDPLTQNEITRTQQALFDAHQGSLSYVDMEQWAVKNLRQLNCPMTAHVSAQDLPKISVSAYLLDTIRRSLMSQGQASNVIAIRQQLASQQFRKYPAPFIEQCQKHAVLRTTGPGRVALALLGNRPICSASEAATITTYSFAHYGLTTAFRSLNISDPMPGKEQVSDESWLENGARKMAEHEVKINHAALRLQSIFRGCQARKALIPSGTSFSESAATSDDILEKLQNVVVA